MDGDAELHEAVNLVKAEFRIFNAIIDNTVPLSSTRNHSRISFIITGLMKQKSA